MPPTPKRKRQRAPGAGRPPRDPNAPSDKSFRVSVTEAELDDLDQRCAESGCTDKRGNPNRAEYVRRQLWPNR